MIFLTACSTGSDSPSVSPTREVATPTPGDSAGTVSSSPIPTAVPTTTTPEGPPDTDRTALIALYDATDGVDWKINDGWLSDGALDKWVRVTTDENGQVKDLDLSANQLSGQIPAELGDLSDLTLLYISDNNLTGALPQSLTGISGLESFHFHNNSGLCAPQLTRLSDMVARHSLSLRQQLRTGGLVGGPGGAGETIRRLGRGELDEQHQLAELNGQSGSGME